VVCSKRATLLGTIRESRVAVGTEFAHGMLSGQLFGLGEIPLPNIGSLGGECGPLRKGAILGKGYAVAFRTNGES
jgi:hypothetical protein